MQPNGLPHQCRLHLKRDFERVILGGKKLKYNSVVCWYGYTNAQRPARFAVVVSKKLGPAVLRNRTKRLLREAFRQIRKNLVPGVDIVVSPKDATQLSNVQAAQLALTTLCGKAALLSSASAPNGKK
ncbi:MAG: ribonuclease P protein component [Elusimicrobiaceae bacterium]|nr:ribonuclease P protein component [Elusimicrobiaceae bacterium]